MNVGVDADQSDALGAIWSAFCTASEKGEEDPLSAMWRAYLNGRNRAQSGEKSSSGVGQHIYIGQYTDNTGLSYLNARYYNGVQGQFTSEDPVFWGEQNLQDPQSFNAYSYAEGNPITKSDPKGLKALGGADDVLVATAPEWGPYAISAMSAGFNVVGTYLSNYLAHQPTTPLEVAVSAGSGALSPSVFGNGFSGLFVSGLLTPAAEDAASNRKLNLGGDTLSGLTNVGTFGLFRWGAGLSPLEQAAEKGVSNASSQTIINNLRYQTVLNTFQTSSGVVAQNSYSHSSFSGGVQQVQNYITSAVQSGAAKIGNAIGGFVGTFNFGSGVGTYNAGTGQWVK
jgi:RHS repeat-associated protein